MDKNRLKKRTTTILQDFASSEKVKRVIMISIVIIVAMSFVIAAIRTYNDKMNRIVVTGSAQKDIVSDLIVWTGTFSTKATRLNDGYDRLQNDLILIRKFLKARNIKENETIVNSIVIDKDFKTVRKGDEQVNIFDGYLLSQSIRIESTDVEKIENLSREITELIKQGVEFYSMPPKYYYTSIADLKKIMVGLATADAHNRAGQIAENSGCSLGKLRNAKMGIFQIIGKNSSENFSSGGTFNTSSKQKTVSVNVNLEYNIR